MKKIGFTALLAASLAAGVLHAQPNDDHARQPREHATAHERNGRPTATPAQRPAQPSRPAPRAQPIAHANPQRPIAHATPQPMARPIAHATPQPPARPTTQHVAQAQPSRPTRSDQERAWQQRSRSVARPAPNVRVDERARAAEEHNYNDGRVNAERDARSNARGRTEQRYVDDRRDVRADQVMRQRAYDRGRVNQRDFDRRREFERDRDWRRRVFVRDDDYDHYRQHFWRRPGWVDYGYAYVPERFAYIPTLSFLADGVCVGSYMSFGHNVYLYVVLENGYRHQVEVRDDGYVVGDDVLPDVPGFGY